MLVEQFSGLWRCIRMPDRKESKLCETPLLGVFERKVSDQIKSKTVVHFVRLIRCIECWKSERCLSSRDRSIEAVCVLRAFNKMNFKGSNKDRIKQVITNLHSKNTHTQLSDREESSPSVNGNPLSATFHLRSPKITKFV